MTSMRLLADDLTGALDTAAAFVPLTGPVPGFWQGQLRDTLPENAAIDAATREGDRETAVARQHLLAGFLAEADIGFKKIDSLLRGHSFAEIAACVASGHWDHVVLAPAFPFQGRVTRNACQYRRDAGGEWQVVADLVAGVRAEGVAAVIARSDDGLAAGVNVFDAEEEDDLHAVVRRSLAAGGRVLWCGSAGLAQALVAVLAPAAISLAPRLRAPVLGLFGSDNEVTAAQLVHCGKFALRLQPVREPATTREDASEIQKRLDRDGAAMVGFALPANTPRAAAALAMRGQIAALLPALRKPASLVVAGGETLRAVCDLLGATHLDVIGTVLPGVPHALLRGGAWDGVDVISKSGAFGAPQVLRDLLTRAGIACERIG